MTLTSLVARNVLRNKLRAVLTMLGVAVAMVTFLLLRTAIGAWTRGAEFAASDRVITRHRVTFVTPLPRRYVDDVARAPHVVRATHSSWFGGKDPKHPKDFFASIAIDGASYFDVYGEIVVPKEQLDAWRADRAGAIVGDMLAERLGWSIGETVTLESGIHPNAPGKPWTFTIRGVYTATSKSIDRSTFLFHWQYLNEGLPSVGQNQVGWITSKVDDASRIAEVTRAIDAAFETRDVPTLSQDERTFRTSLLAAISAVLTTLDVVSVAILVMMTLILGNTIAMGARERTHEYGVLRALGFTPRHIAAFVFGEAMLTGGAGGVLGVAIAFPLLEIGVARYLDENMRSFFPFFRIDPTVAALALAGALLLGAVAAAIPAWKASRIRVIDAIRKVN